MYRPLIILGETILGRTKVMTPTTVQRSVYNAASIDNSSPPSTLEWMIPCNGPDVTPIHRIQSAFPDEILNKNKNIIDSIVCQVRLKVAKIKSSANSSDDVDEIHRTNDSLDGEDLTTTTYVWTLEPLNRYGAPTLHIPHSFPFVPQNRNAHPLPQQPPHEFYLVFHTHEHSIPGNRPLAIGVMSPINSTNNMNSHKDINNKKNSNQTHTIRWVTSPMNFPSSTATTSSMPSSILLSKRGHVSIHFQYSVGLGWVPPPYKHSLLHGGAIQTYYLCPNVVAPTDHDNNVNENATTPTTLRNDATIMNLTPFQIPTIPQRLSSYDIIIAYGDSILEQFIASQRFNENTTIGSRNDHRPNPALDEPPVLTPRIHFGPKIAAPLNHRTVATLLDEFDTFVQPFVREARSESSSSSSPSIALLLNGALWDVLSDEATMEITSENIQEQSIHDNDHDPWDEHIDTLVQYLTWIRTKYPTIHIYWILPTSVHIHRVHVLSDPSLLVKAPQKIARTKYMSASRTYQLYQRQKDAIDLLNTNASQAIVSCIDIYEATYLSADWTLPGDGRHYRPELNQRLLSWFY